MILNTMGNNVGFNEKSRAYCKIFMQFPTRESMYNVETTLSTEEIGGFVFPVTLNTTEYESSYVCSPYNAYVSYSQDELVKIKNKWLRYLSGLLMRSIGGLLRAGEINKNYCINNFLLSTNPYPNWNGEGAAAHLKKSLASHPTHAIMYRSLNHHTNAELIKHLTDLGFILVPSRQVYIFDKQLGDFQLRNNNHNDRRAYANMPYQLVLHEQISKEDYPTIVRLYNLLYLEKYSKHNPQFSEKLIAYWHQNQVLTMFGLRDAQGVLQGVVGLFESDSIITAPLVGYNTVLPSQKALYRILIHLILDYSLKKERCLNLSSGASQFKLLRGAHPFIEYSALYIKHLPLRRRVTWKSMRWILNSLFVPIVRRYKL